QGRNARPANGTDRPATFEGYAATVDWPGAAFWRQLVAEYPDAVVLLSKRESARLVEQRQPHHLRGVQRRCVATTPHDGVVRDAAGPPRGLRHRPHR
ncbi:MAG: sulfotransferase, partial [Acidimicrobiales bacterium]